MPTVLREDGFEIMIYTHDHEPKHVHIFRGEAALVVNLENLTLIKNYAMSGRDVRAALQIVARNQDFLLRRWLEIGPIS